MLHWCDPVSVLLGAGTPLAELKLEASPAFEAVQGDKLTVKLPAWALEPLRRDLTVRYDACRLNSCWLSVSRHMHVTLGFPGTCMSLWGLF